MKLSIIQLFDILLSHYGVQHWWPCQSGARGEIITGAILTQNTAWTNVEKAISNLLAADVMSPYEVLETSDEDLQELIRPAGFFKQKCAYLKAIAQFIIGHEVEFEKSDDVWALRKQLLAVKGVAKILCGDITPATSKLPIAFSTLVQAVFCVRIAPVMISHRSPDWQGHQCCSP